MTPAHILDGVTVPLVTALDDGGRPSAVAARPLVEALSRAGVHSLMLLGSNGEGALLPASWTRDYVIGVTDLWRELRPGGRVIVNVSAPGSAEMLERAEVALECGPDALVVSPPRYFSYRPDEIVAHIRALDRHEHSYAVYNIPKYAAPLTAETFEALLDAPCLIGMKDSSGDPNAFAAFLELTSGRDEVALTQGSERRLLSALEAGADGIVPGVANIAPALAVRIFEQRATGPDGAARAQATIAELLGFHAIRPGVPSVKAILHDRGLIATPTPVSPLAPLAHAERDAIRLFLEPYEADLIGARHG